MAEETKHGTTESKAVDRQQDCSDLMSLKDFQAEMAKINGWAQHGCSDGGCQIEKPNGMHTNGGCRCNPREFSEYLLWLACEIEKHGRYRRWPKGMDGGRRTQDSTDTTDAL